MGIPVMGCSCDVCTSANPKNKRTRPSVLLTIGEKRILIDACQELRLQMVREGVQDLDAVILTHTHHDHTAGVDDIRSLFFNRDHPLPLILSDDTYQDLKTRYHYIFEKETRSKTLIPHFEVHTIDDERGVIDLFGQKIQYMTVSHAGMPVKGFRFGNLAYICEIKTYPESLLEDLDGIETLVVSALRFEETPVHFTVPQAIEFAKRVGAPKVYFTHIAHELEHDAGNRFLPEHIRLAYDGLKLSFGI